MIRRQTEELEMRETVAVGPFTVTTRVHEINRQRTFLLKQIKPQITRPKTARRILLRERDAVEKVTHPGLATLIDVLVDENDQPCLLFVDHRGIRLDAVLDRLPKLEPDCAICVALCVAEALDAAHRKKLVHGHVRLAEVEVSESGHVVLHGLGSSSPMPQDDEKLRRPGDMAPEQVLGGSADERTDVFAVGVLLHRCLTGRHPFEDGDNSGVTHAIRHNRPPKVSRFADVTSRVDRLVERCLEKRSIDRFPDMGSVVSELEGVLRSATTVPRDVLVSRALSRAQIADALPGPREVAPPAAAPWPIERIKRLAAAAAGIAAVALVGSWVVSWLSSPVETTPHSVRGVANGPAKIRLLAHPWAYVYVDGTRVATTPIGFPVEVEPGKHTVVFKHPNAPDESRIVEIVSGQTVLLDIHMQIIRENEDDAAKDADLSDEDRSP